jgi:hypothetical protein
VPAGFSTVIKQLVVTNTTGSAATFTFYIGDAVAGNALFSATSVAANDTVIINLSQVLQSNEVLRALASANSTLNLTVSGVENDGPLEPSANFIANDSVTVNKIADGSVTSAKIADETIVNTDINASAAIAQSKVANLTSDLALKAPLVSPAFTGTPTAPTANSTTNNTQIATTAFVTTAVGLVKIISGSLAGGDTNFVGCFSSAYNVYEIYITNVRAGGNAQLYFRMLSGTTVANTNNYDTQRLYAQGVSVGGARELATIGRIGYMGGGTNQLTHYRMTLINPNIAKYTFSISRGSYSDSSVLANIEQNNVAHTLANAYDGIIIGSTGTATVEGTVTIYGVKQ